MEKTENLNYIEARVAIAEGKIAQAHHGSKWRWKNLGLEYSGGDDEDFAPGDYMGPMPSDEPLSVVLPEPKSLTFEEALQRCKVDIHLPEGVVYVHLEKELTGKVGFAQYETENGGAWHTDIVKLLDLAERRGWSITEVSNK